jgi:hypothetical protein
LSKEAIPAFELHGNNLIKGVRFSVQTDSLDNAANLNELLSISIAGLKAWIGSDIKALSMKFKEAQNNPAKEFERPIQLLSILVKFNYFLVSSQVHRLAP